MTRGAGLLAVIVCVGCSSVPADDARCSVDYAGNVSGSASLANACAHVEQRADGAFTLHVEASSKRLPTLAVDVALGATPAPGVLSPPTAGFSASGVSPVDATCLFTAGSDAVPPGSFILDLTAVQARDGGAAHGSLELDLTLHAPPGVDCGAGDAEHVTVRF